MNFKKILLGMCAFLIMQVTATAQTVTPQVKQHQINQQKRIHQGVRSGELNKRETVQLQKQQKKVNQHKKVVKSDGVVTPKERARLQAHQAKASKSIYRKKHN